MELPAGQWSILEAVSFGLGTLMLIPGGAAVVVFAIAWIRDRKLWRLLLVFLSIHWLIGVVTQYVSWLALVQTGWDLLESTGMQGVVSVLVPMDLVVLPAWVLLLLRGRVGRPTLLVLIVNCLAFFGLFALLKLPIFTGFSGAVSTGLKVISILQSSGLYVAFLVWGLVELMRSSSRMAERRYGVLLAVLLFSFALNSMLYAAPPEDLRSWYMPIILLLPFIVAVGLGVPASFEVRRMAQTLREAERMHKDAHRIPSNFVEEYGFSRREGEVAQELLEGRRTSQIARRLYISEPTVNTHIRSIYRKCDVHSRAEFLGLVSKAIASNLGMGSAFGAVERTTQPDS